MSARWLKALLADAGRIEIRHLPSGKSIVVDDIEKAMQVVASRAGSGNIYATLNRPGVHVEAGSTQALRDDDIAQIVLLPFDFDPARPAGCGSTAAELQAAIEARDTFVRSMSSRGWPAPAVATSGNGAHALYRVSLPNDEGTRQMLRASYTGLAERFSDDEVTFDRTVRNPARIWRLYGTVNRKGPSSAERPHRVATVRLPADWRRVPLKEIERLASEFARRPVERRSAAPVDRPRVSGRGDFSTLDVCAWFRAHGLYVGHVAANLHEVGCPWEAEHSSSSPRDTVIFADDGSGWPGFFCHHAHCAGRTIRDVMRLWGDADAWCARQWTGGAA